MLGILISAVGRRKTKRKEPLNLFKIGYARDCSGSGAQWMCDCCC